MSTPPPSSASRRLSDHQVELFIGWLLQVGVLIAAAVAISGGILLFSRHGSNVPSVAVFHGQPAYLTSVSGIVRGVREQRADAIIQLGIVLLIATPMARVAFTLVAFVLQRDRTYVGITLVVLLLLLFGLLYGRG